MTGRPPRLLFYSHNGVGVGHFRRQLRLAEAFRRRHPDAVVLMVTGSHAPGAFADPLGLDHVRLPSIRMVDRYETWESRQPGVAIGELMQVRADLLKRTVRRFHPDLLIADFMPAGPYGELVGALRELAAAGGRAVAGFRDIIDEPGFVRDLWARTGVYDVLREHYAAICVYGARAVVDFEVDYGLTGELARRLHYLGYLGRPAPTRTPPHPEGAELIACTGGGVDGGGLLTCVIEAVHRLPPGLVGRHLVVGGPLLSGEELRALRSQGARSGVEVTGFISELDQRIAASELVVTMPGYNTTCELISSSTRAIVVPRSGPSLEQRMRASELERWGRARTLEPLELNPATLAAAIEASLAAPRPSPPPVPLDGLERAVTTLESLVSGEPAAVSA